MTALEKFNEFFKEGLARAPAALERMAKARQQPPEPIMPQEDYDALEPGSVRKIMLCCNMPSCPNVVSTHGLLCVEHLDPEGEQAFLDFISGDRDDGE